MWTANPIAHTSDTALMANTPSGVTSFPSGTAITGISAAPAANVAMATRTPICRSTGSSADESPPAPRNAAEPVDGLA